MFRLLLLLVTIPAVHSQYGFRANFSLPDVTEYPVEAESIDPGGATQYIYPSTPTQPMESKKEVTTTIGSDEMAEEVTEIGLNTTMEFTNATTIGIKPMDATTISSKGISVYNNLIREQTKIFALHCNDKRFKCFVGDLCVSALNGTHSNSIESGHTKLVRLRHPIDMSATKCDLLAMIEPIGAKGYFFLAYNVPEKYLNLSIPISEIKGGVEISIEKGKLTCSFNCSIESPRPISIDSESHFFETKYLIFEKKPRADLKWCLKSKKPRCFIGNGCLEGLKGNHSSIVYVDKDMKKMLRNDTKLLRMAESCDVGAMRKQVEGSSKHKFLFVYHTSTAYLDMPIIFQTKSRIEIIGGKLISSSARNITTLYAFREENYFYWAAYIFYLGEKSSSKPDTPPNKNTTNRNSIVFKSKPGSKAQLGTIVREEKEEEESIEEKKEEQSNIGTIVLISLSVLAVCVIVAIVVGAMLQRYNTAKHKAKREKIEAANKRVARPPVVVQPVESDPLAKRPLIPSSDPIDEISASERTFE